jgi:hypothetical protein
VAPEAQISEKSTDYIFPQANCDGCIEGGVEGFMGHCSFRYFLNHNGDGDLEEGNPTTSPACILKVGNQTTAFCKILTSFL